MPSEYLHVQEQRRQIVKFLDHRLLALTEELVQDQRHAKSLSSDSGSHRYLQTEEEGHDASEPRRKDASGVYGKKGGSRSRITSSSTATSSSESQKPDERTRKQETAPRQVGKQHYRFVKRGGRKLSI